MGAPKHKKGGAGWPRRCSGTAHIIRYRTARGNLLSFDPILNRTVKPFPNVFSLFLAHPLTTESSMKIAQPVLLTGATGFVGGHLAETLGKKGVKTRLLVRSVSRLAFKPGKSHEIALGDVTDPQAVRKAMVGVKTVMHLAGVLRGFNFKDYDRVNREGSLNLAKAALEAKTVKRFIQVSSLAGSGPSTPGRPRREGDPAAPVSFYGSTKLAGEEAVKATLGSKVAWTVVRPAGVYGPREKDIFQYFQMVHRGLAVLPGDGRQRVSYVHVNDLVDAILLSAGPKAVGKTYFVASEDADWLELVALIERALGKRAVTLKIPLPLVKLSAFLSELVGRARGQAAILNLDKVKEAVPTAWTCDSRAIRTGLGWKPKWTLEAGIRQAAESYRAAGWL